MSNIAVPFVSTLKSSRSRHHRQILKRDHMIHHVMIMTSFLKTLFYFTFFGDIYYQFHSKYINSMIISIPVYNDYYKTQDVNEEACKENLLQYTL